MEPNRPKGSSSEDLYGEAGTKKGAGPQGRKGGARFNTKGGNILGGSGVVSQETLIRDWLEICEAIRNIPREEE